MRVVFDANVLARAVYAVGGPAELAVSKTTEAPHTLVLSTSLVDELRRVLNYPRLKRLHGLSAETINEVVDNLEASAALITIDASEVVPVVTQDPDDDWVIATAVLGKSDILCTLDKHLYHSDVISYCQNHTIRVVTDVELLLML